VFNYFKQVIVEWLDWTDPNTTKEIKPNSKVDLRKELIKLPYKINGNAVTKEQFL